MDESRMKEMVRALYGGIAAAADAGCCAPATSSCCGPETTPHDKARRMGYSEVELAAVPEGANLATPVDPIGIIFHPIGAPTASSGPQRPPGGN
jgi:hypothetical protein